MKHYRRKIMLGEKLIMVLTGHHHHHRHHRCCHHHHPHHHRHHHLILGNIDQILIFIILSKGIFREYIVWKCKCYNQKTRCLIKNIPRRATRAILASCLRGRLQSIFAAVGASAAGKDLDLIRSRTSLTSICFLR